ncbi:MAG: ABC transporter permease [Ardenticatenaceae bacterium]|nr:ABC transporter permease [Ardenticatenaceae bacterium]HBY97946.1 hypothetical protein [Chloroflexota bacterium]
MFVVKRLIQGVGVLVAALLFIFILVRLVPGSPAEVMLPPGASDEAIQAMNQQLGLDKSLPEQLLLFVSDLARGDFGYSHRYGRAAIAVVLEKAPVTFKLILGAALISTLISLPLGIYSAVRPGSLLDNASLLIVLAGQSVPTFWLGLVFILIFAIQLGWLPTSGGGSWKHYVLPSLSLAAWTVAVQTRITRVSFMEVLSEPYITVARSKGLPSWLLYVRHVFPNVAPPILMVMGVEFGYMVGGAVITEVVFGLPGLGALALDAITLRDYSVVQAMVIFVATILVILNLVIDLLHAYLDPRIRSFRR